MHLAPLAKRKQVADVQLQILQLQADQFETRRPVA
jgi:hypothetical protein